MENQIFENYKSILDDVKSTCLKANKDPENINIIAVCKRQPLFKVEQSIKIGIKDFGENRIQDAKNQVDKAKIRKNQIKFSWSIANKQI